MSETFFEKWKHRISSAWAVLTGRAYAAYYNQFPQENEPCTSLLQAHECPWMTNEDWNDLERTLNRDYAKLLAAITDVVGSMSND